MASVNVRFVGSFQELAGVESKTYNIQDRTFLKDLFKQLLDEVKNHKLRGRFKNVLEEKYAGFLVLINGAEVGTQGGLSLELEDGDEITFIPISHGG